MKKYNKSESGRSMVEMIGVLSVMGLITAGAFALISYGMASHRISRANDDVANIAENVRALFAESANYNNLPSTYLAGTTLLDAMSLTTTTPFGSSTTYSVIQDSENSKGFVVVLNGLNANMCSVLANRAWVGSTGVSCDESNVLHISFSN